MYFRFMYSVQCTLIERHHFISILVCSTIRRVLNILSRDFWPCQLSLSACIQFSSENKIVPIKSLIWWKCLVQQYRHVDFCWKNATFNHCAFVFVFTFQCCSFASPIEVGSRTTWVKFLERKKIDVAIELWGSPNQPTVCYCLSSLPAINDFMKEKSRLLERL